MFIRQTRTNNKITGEGYFTFRLVRGERRGGQVRQITVLNLGRHFSVKQEDWPLLCLRLEQLLHPQDNFLPIPCSEALEVAAQRYFGQLVERAVPPALPVADPVTLGEADNPGNAMEPERPVPDFQEVDIDSLQLTQPRSVAILAT